ncbi:hypothetical protein F4680DRAFT_472116 [Xylaria scruposa]|nr:hypothetical protein F4680DRAFT_472116 [Xylaria scruposa]
MFNLSALFLHRTVVNFINQPQIFSRLFEQIGGEFKPAVALFEVHSGQFSSLFHLHQMNQKFLKPYLCNWLLGSVYYAREVEVTHEISLMGKLHALEATLMDYFRTRLETEYSFSKVLSMMGRYLPRGNLILPDEDLELINIRFFAGACGLNLQHGIEGQQIQGVNFQMPSLYIKKAGDFEVRIVTDEMKKNRPNFLVAKPVYNNTFEMLTLSEAEALERSRLLIKQPSVMMTPAQSSPYGPEAAISGQQKPNGNYPILLYNLKDIARLF